MVYVLGLRYLVLPLAAGLGSEGRVLSGEPWVVSWVVFLNVVMSWGCIEYPCARERRTETFEGEDPQCLPPVLGSLA